MIVLPVLLVIGVAVLFDAWVFMLLVGVIHSEWLPMVPTIGFSASLVISGVSSLLLAPIWIITAIANAD